MEEPSGWVVVRLHRYLGYEEPDSQDDWVVGFEEDEEEGEYDDDEYDDDFQFHCECEIHFLSSWSRLTTVKRRICVHALMGVLLKELLPYRAKQCSSEETDFALPYLEELYRFHGLCREQWTLPMTQEQGNSFDKLNHEGQLNATRRNVPPRDRHFWHLAFRLILTYLEAVGPACTYRKYVEEEFVRKALQALCYLTDPLQRSAPPAISHYDEYFMREQPDAEILRDRFSQCAQNWFEECKKALAWRTAMEGEYVK